MNILSENNIFYINDNTTINNSNKIIKEDSNLEENNQRNSISTNETLENGFNSDDEINFHQDFFPKSKIFKFTDFLVNDWENKIKVHLTKIKKDLLKDQNL